MSLEVYWISGSPYCWSVLLLLEYKGVEYTSKLLSADRQEHKAPEFLQMNPRGSVPVIRDADVIVYESLAILMYLEKKFGAKPLFGETANEVAKIWQAISEFNSYILDPMYHMASMVFRQTALQKQMEFMRLSDEVKPELDRLNRVLSTTAYMAGDTLSGADIICYPRFTHFLLALTEPEVLNLEHGLLPFKQQYPAISNWLARIENIQGYENTYPPHWRSLTPSDC